MSSLELVMVKESLLANFDLDRVGKPTTQREKLPVAMVDDVPRLQGLSWNSSASGGSGTLVLFLHTIHCVCLFSCIALL